MDTNENSGERLQNILAHAGVASRRGAATLIASGVVKMCSAAHLVVLSLRRVAVGAFELPPDLEPGTWRDLTETEIARLFN